MSDEALLLLVDDEEGNLIALESVLEGPDVKIIKAMSGNEALGFSAGQIRYSATVNADFDLVAP